MSGSYNIFERTGTVADVEGALEKLRELYDEIDEIVQNASGTPAENSPRIQTLTETADSLSNVPEGIDIPQAIINLPIKYMESVHKFRSASPSRAIRRDNACSIIRSVIEVAEEFQEQHEDEDMENVEAFVTEIADAADEAEGCEFPGMFQS